ncbi:hypothetical protein [Pleionea litopenaei]|uniref:Lipoprotein n=1 Tax=Pleionea litopenaei TaxID=3070815 RepID=A0AA51X5H6_9GAMM|nr:hypothetical protein [Pleionea sp. HL-JVS1]WMS86107.1 hypothetical protein Q9312_12850 [Pleionea sp. HL-JVS1]
MIKNHQLPIAVFVCITLALTSGCKSKHLKTIGAIIAVGVAAKIIYDMVIAQRSEQTENDQKVVEKYKKEFKQLPAEPQLINYESSIMPGAVVNPGNSVSIQSSLEVVRGSTTELVEIKERITIYDNEDPTKPLKSLEKVINQETQKCGAFKNEFTFTLPKGMPQGVYPVTTTVIVDGKEFSAVQNKMQLVQTGNLINANELIAAN